MNAKPDEQIEDRQESDEVCPRCGGTGERKIYPLDVGNLCSRPWDYDVVICLACNGSGRA